MGAVIVWVIAVWAWFLALSTFCAIPEQMGGHIKRNEIALALARMLLMLGEIAMLVHYGLLVCGVVS